MDSPKSKLSKSQKAKIRNAELKKSNPEEWQRRRDDRNEKRRMKWQELKKSNPEEYKEKCESRNEKVQAKRINIIEECPEEHETFLANERQKRLADKIQTWTNLFDSHFEKYSFPTISEKQWESLKKDEIEFFQDEFNNDVPISFLYEYRQDCLDFLRQNPDCPCGGSVLFYIKTFVHRPRDKRKITPEEIDFINSLVLDCYEREASKSYRKDYYEKNQKKEIELGKLSYQKKKSNQKNENLNRRFISADPNKVLSIDDICHNPFMRNYSDREEYKVNLWKNLNEREAPEFLEKWKIQRENYEKEVGDLSVEYKTDFLKRMESKDYSEEFEARKEKHLDHFRK